jgi:hypothetical protein
MKRAPIALFAYNRPELLRETLQSLQDNEGASESELFIFCDGPKAGASVPDLEKIERVRQIAREKKWCGTVNVIEKTTNQGLATSIIGGITELLATSPTVIVIEDDVRLSPYFLSFMNDSLNTYLENDKVLAVGSWNYFCSPEKIEKDTFFFRYPDSIAWATFERAWKLFEKDAQLALEKLESTKRMNAFNGDGEALYFGNMLTMQIKGQINSWAIRWTATAIIHDKLCVFPKETLSKHMGFGADATHEKTDDDYNAHLHLCNRELKVVPLPVAEDPIALGEWKKFIRANFLKQERKRPAALARRLASAAFRRIKKIFNA